MFHQVKAKNVLHVSVLSSFHFTIYMHICVAGDVEQSEMQDPGHLGQKMKNVNRFLWVFFPFSITTGKESAKKWDASAD